MAPGTAPELPQDRKPHVESLSSAKTTEAAQIAKLTKSTTAKMTTAP